jgi:uncharacterized protein YdhG (YjbR/CyaY superfamily)
MKSARSARGSMDASIAAFPPDMQACSNRYGQPIPRGTLKFPLDQPLPLGLIRSIVQFRIKENSERSPIKGK